MNLHGSVKDLQNKIVQLYLKLEHRFSENGLIRELWSGMANDVSLQIRSLNALPPSFWNQLKKDQILQLIAAAEVASRQSIEIKEDQSLMDCFNIALCLEEPAILKVYAPLIRRLRENSSAPALDFYIVVKAHLARIMRVTQSFSGDPAVVQRANSLLQAFEKEVQEPHIKIAKPEPKKALAGHSAKHTGPVQKQRKTSVKARPSAKPAKILHRHPKPLAKKASIARQRARR
jgi:hypothetical protein